jgi:hypothetical protein
MKHLKENLQQTSEDSYGNIVPNTSSARFRLYLTVADVLGNKYPKEEIINDRMIMDCIAQLARIAGRKENMLIRFSRMSFLPLKII